MPPKRKINYVSYVNGNVNAVKREKKNTK